MRTPTADRGGEGPDDGVGFGFGLGVFVTEGEQIIAGGAETKLGLCDGDGRLEL